MPSPSSATEVWLEVLELGVIPRFWERSWAWWVPSIGSLQIGQFAFLHGVCLVQLLEALSWGEETGRAASSWVSNILVRNIEVASWWFNTGRATSSSVSVILGTDIEVASWGFNARRAMPSTVLVILVTARYKGWNRPRVSKTLDDYSQIFSEMQMTV